MTSCPDCNSKNIFRFEKEIEAGGGYGPELLPKLNDKWFSMAKFLPLICGDCGLVRFYASEKSREILKSSKHWKLV